MATYGPAGGLVEGRGLEGLVYEAIDCTDKRLIHPSVSLSFTSHAQITSAGLGISPALFRQPAAHDFSPVPGPPAAIRHCRLYKSPAARKHALAAAERTTCVNCRFLPHSPPKCTAYALRPLGLPRDCPSLELQSPLIPPPVSRYQGQHLRFRTRHSSDPDTSPTPQPWPHKPAQRAMPLARSRSPRTSTGEPRPRDLSRTSRSTSPRTACRLPLCAPLVSSRAPPPPST